MEKTATKKIEITCCGNGAFVEELITTLELFIPSLKEPVYFKRVQEDIRSFIESNVIVEGMTLVIDDPELLPEKEFYRKKASKVYYYIDSIEKTESWISNPLIDGVIFKGSDTTVKSFLEDIVCWNYRIYEKLFPKPIRPWIETLNGDVSMMTASFGKMSCIYNELKRFVYFQNLEKKFSDTEVTDAFSYFVDFMRSIQLENYKEKQGEFPAWFKDFLNIKDQLKKDHVRTVSILLTGESGVGKSLLAGFVQKILSQDKAGDPLTKLNCSQMGKEQIRTELFGAMPGSYTGQLTGMPGRLLENALGVVILDEIADLDISLQPQLLSYLDDSETLMLHAKDSIYCPVFLIATTNKHISQEIEKGTFRRDLYQRFDLHLEIPPVRERMEEIKPFIKMAFYRMHMESPHLMRDLSISKACLNELCKREYREGNFREISRTIQHAVRNTISRGDDLILVSDLY